MTNRPSHLPFQAMLCVYIAALKLAVLMIEMTCKLLQHRLLEKGIDLSDSRFKYKEFKVSMKHTIPLQLNIIICVDG